MSQTVSDFVLERLHQWGVRRIYGFPGDGINGIMGAFRGREAEIEFIQTRHEEMAAFMACAHAKLTGEVGVCLATSGPGAIHLLNGLYDAAMDHQPVVAIVGQQDRMAMGGAYQQEVDLKNLFKDVAREFIEVANTPQQMRHLIDRAVRIALADRCVTCVVVPKDIQEMEYQEPPRTHGSVHSGVGYNPPRIIPRDNDLRRAADLLNSGQRVAMLVGAGALQASDEVASLAEKLGAGVAKALLGRTVLPDTLPYVTGPIGLLGTKPSWRMMNECDTFLMIGTSFPYAEFLPKEGQARGVQIDIDGRLLGMRYPNEINLVGDSKETVRKLLPMIEQKRELKWQQGIERDMDDWYKLMDERAHTKANPINPQLVFFTLSPKLPEGAIVTTDSGSSTNWWARDLKMRKGMRATLSGNLATMGCGVPYAIAAKFAHPERPVIACVGDGAMQMNGMAELLTVAKYWKKWADPRFVVLVLNNRDLNQVTWEMRAMSGDPKLEASQDIPDFRYADFAKLIGLDGARIEKPEELDDAWDRALASDKPFVFEAFTDPDVPPLPPHIRLKQAKAFASSLFKGDPNEMGIIRQSIRTMFPGVAEKV
ncbi:MAG TPA: thiamine pyrophosphate-requiring protein [Polyangiaceae bacterium]|jgi:pyruvate dehydrogenase (quinone)